ncbi:MAG: ATP synthase subunit I [Betaproteobacteria bacterium]
MTPYLKSRPVRATLRWQCAATLILMLVAGLWMGPEGAISAAMGGLITVSAGLAYAVVISISDSGSAGATLRTMMRAEATKIAVIVLLLWAVITQYQALAAAAFFAAFVITVLLNRVAFLVPDASAAETGRTEPK